MVTFFFPLPLFLSIDNVVPPSLQLDSITNEVKIASAPGVEVFYVLTTLASGETMPVLDPATFIPYVAESTIPIDENTVITAVTVMGFVQSAMTSASFTLPNAE